MDYRKVGQILLQGRYLAIAYGIVETEHLNQQSTIPEAI